MRFLLLLAALFPYTAHAAGPCIWAANYAKCLTSSGLWIPNGGIKFPDNSIQTTAATATTPGSTSGAVQFNASGAFGGNAAKFFWDATNFRLGIGNATPASTLVAEGSAANDFDVCIRVINDSAADGAYSFLYLGNGTSPYDVSLFSAGPGTTSLGGPRSGGVGTNTATPFLLLTNTTERMRIDSAGKVGIGTTTPAEVLDVNGNVRASTFVSTGTSTGGVFYRNSSGVLSNDITNFFWDSGNHYLGLGTNSPDDKLQISGSVDSGPFGMRITNNSAATTAFSTLYLGNSSATTDVVLFGGGTNTTFYGGPRSGGVGTNTAAPFVFLTNAAERMRIDGAGKVGIGTTTPAYTLDVAGGARATTQVITPDVIANTAANSAGANLAVDGGASTIAPSSAGGNGGALVLSGGQPTDDTAGNGGNPGSVFIKTWAPIPAGTPVLTTRMSFDTSTNKATITWPLAANHGVDTSASIDGVKVGSGKLIGSGASTDYLDLFNGEWGTPGGGHIFKDTSGGATWNGPTAAGAAGSVLVNDGTGVTSWSQSGIVSSTTNTSATCSATCGAGLRVKGGGCQNSGVGLNLENTYPSSVTAWSCTYTAATGNCTAYAICE